MLLKKIKCQNFYISSCKAFKIITILTLLVFFSQSSIAQYETKDIKVAKKEAKRIKKEGYKSTDILPIHIQLLKNWDIYRFNLISTGNHASFDSVRSFAIARIHAYHFLVDSYFLNIPNYIEEGLKEQIFTKMDTLILMNWFRQCHSLSLKIDPINNVWDKETQDSLGTNNMLSLISRAEEISLRDYEIQISELSRNQYPFDISPYNWIDSTQIKNIFTLFRVIKKTQNKYYQKGMYEFNVSLSSPFIDNKSKMKLYEILHKRLTNKQ